MITLPKEWAERVGLKKNDPVWLQPHPDGTMIIHPQSEMTSNETTKVLEIESDIDRNLLYRQLVGAYIAGHDRIEIVSEDRISSVIASTASSFAQVAIGLEILEEDDRRIVIKDLMDPEEIRPVKSILRMKVLVRNMLNDILDGMIGGDLISTEMMNERDREIDRLDWLISRQVNIHQKDISLSARMGVDLCDITRCAIISRSIERIGDHAVLLTDHMRALEKDEGWDRAIQLVREMIALFVKSIDTWVERDMVTANECIDQGAEMVAQCRSMISDVDRKRGPASMELALGSMKRIMEYSVDIAEVAINSAMD